MRDRERIRDPSLERRSLRLSQLTHDLGGSGHDSFLYRTYPPPVAADAPGEDVPEDVLRAAWSSRDRSASFQS